MKKLTIIILIMLLLCACSTNNDDPNKRTIASGDNKSTLDVPATSKYEAAGNSVEIPQDTATLKKLINSGGNIIETRIDVPDGYERIKVNEGSFGQYLRKLPLKPDGTKVRYYNGEIKPGDVYAAIIDLDVGNRDLQQCADAVMRLRAEYLYGKKLFNKIHFNLSNGFLADYATWQKGNRIKVNGDNVYWVKQAEPSNDYASFRKYMDIVFAYAGTLSLAKELKKVELSDMMPGDVFIKGGSPGHAEIVVDMAENKTNGDKIFLLAQSYMPAQDIHLLKNPANDDGNPWYTIEFGETLNTPEYVFSKNQLMRFPD